jgi:hypothetical protein
MAPIQFMNFKAEQGLILLLLMSASSNAAAAQSLNDNSEDRHIGIGQLTNIILYLRIV